ncbi:MAG: class F sortase [Actinomycetota bacterium]|nr:class F sortase [Actinomycetota bacterium]
MLDVRHYERAPGVHTVNLPARRRLGHLSSRLRRPLLALLAIGAIAIGAFLISAGSRTHRPSPAPLPSATFSVAPGRLPALALPPLVPGTTPTAVGTRPAGNAPAPGSGAAGQGSSGGGRSCSYPVSAGRVVIAAACIDGPVVMTTRTSAGALNIPDDVHEVGMWNGGAPLVGLHGAPLAAGTTLLAGHVSYLGQGDGTFFNLRSVQAGDLVYVADAAAHVTRWRVNAISVVLKAALPADVFAGPRGPRRLVMVTCGGPVFYVPGYGNSFEDNVVVSAVPA